MLTLYSLGAPKEAIEQHYKHNTSYQSKLPEARKDISEDMKSPEQFKKFLGKGKYYSEFLFFFKKEMADKGWENVLNEFLFSGDERAEDLLGRVFAGTSNQTEFYAALLNHKGFFHPFIHLGFGVEFKQPAIIAEALAQAAVHDDWMSFYLFTTERESTASSTKTMPDLLDEIRKDAKLSSAAEWDDANKVRDGILKRAPGEMINYAKQWTVSEADIDQKTAEIINTTIYFTAAAQRPPKQACNPFSFSNVPTFKIWD